MRTDQRLPSILPNGPPTGVGKPPRIRIDWRAYFESFREAHGRFPLLYKGRLLFPDGWTYSSTDHRGPEWPPPEDDEGLLALVITYWRLRRDAVKKELIVARDRLATLEELLRTKHLPLIQSTSMVDQETGRTRTSSKPLDAEGARHRVLWLEDDLKECNLELGDEDETRDQADNVRQTAVAE